MGKNSQNGNIYLQCDYGSQYYYVTQLPYIYAYDEYEVQLIGDGGYQENFYYPGLGEFESSAYSKFYVPNNPGLTVTLQVQGNGSYGEVYLTPWNE